MASSIGSLSSVRQILEERGRNRYAGSPKWEMRDGLFVIRPKNENCSGAYRSGNPQLKPMNELLSKLTGEQALQVLKGMASDDAGLARKIDIEAKRVLAAVDIDEVGEDVFCTLDMIDVQDCWDRAGSGRDGYTSPEDAVVELIEEELQPFVDQMKRYHELNMLKQERDYCAGVILGLYRYEKESKSEFRNWSEDLPMDSAGWLRDEWRERTADKAMRNTMDDFIRERCPDWAKQMIRA